MWFIEDLENSVDIVDLVGRYTKLKKAGVNYKALCPFPGHSEKTPSFVVSPVKQIAYCFGCHKGGGPIKFISDMENSEFRESVQILWNITGREIQGFTENKEKIQIKKNLYSLYKDATQYYKNALEKHPEVKKYLMDRWLSAEDIQKFQFWYADSGVWLYNYLKEKWYDDTLMNQSHIFIDVARRKDKFIGRVIFPIANLRGDIVAFAGRILGKGEPKYLNSPASDIYDKSSILYGLFEARNTITKVDHVIITEGYMDAIALHRAGFFQSVAVSGTALTEKHILILKRLTKKIYLCFDNDKAWDQATKSSLEILKNKDLEVKIILLSGAKDPDEYLEQGKDFQNCIDQALTPIGYHMQKHSYNLSSLDEKKKFIAEMLDIIRHYGNSIEQDTYLKELAKYSNTPIKIIYENFRKTHLKQQVSEESTSKKQNTPQDILIAYLLVYPEYHTDISQKFIFPESIDNELEKFLKDSKKYQDSLSYDQNQELKALKFQIEEKHESEWEIHDSIQNIIKQIDRNSFRVLTQKYKEEIQDGDAEALKKYTEILSIAKKHAIK